MDLEMDTDYLRKVIRLLREGPEQKSSVVGIDSIDSQVNQAITNYISGNSVKSYEDGSEGESSGDDDAKMPSDKFIKEDFARDVANLIENFTNLIEIKKTVFRKAINMLSQSYSRDVVEEVKNILQEQYEISDSDSEDDEKAPYAADAGPVGSGGGGGV